MYKDYVQGGFYIISIASFCLLYLHAILNRI